MAWCKECMSAYKASKRKTDGPTRRTGVRHGRGYRKITSKGDYSRDLLVLRNIFFYEQYRWKRRGCVGDAPLDEAEVSRREELYERYKAELKAAYGRAEKGGAGDVE